MFDLATMSRWSRWAVTALLLAFGLFFALVAGEWVARLAFHGVTTTGEGLTRNDARWKAFVKRHELNRHKFREREYETAKASGVYRIAVLGDSITFGQGIDLAARYTNRLERALNALGHDHRYEVLQFAKPGYEIHVYDDLLENIVFEAQPDFVLLQWYINDFEIDKSDRPPSGQLLWNRKSHADMLGRSALYFLANRAYQAIYRFVNDPATYPEYLKSRFADAKSPDSRYATELLVDLVELIRRRRQPFGIVLFPALSAHLGADYEYDFLHEIVLSVCRTHKLHCLDLRERFAQAGDGTRYWVNRFDAHPGPEAHALAAQALLEEFAALWSTH